MTTIMEQSKWAREKQPVVQSFVNERRKLVSSVAGRGFTFPPGFMYELETELELSAKFALSEIGYKILSEAVERDLKQSGLDYDLAFKTAAMTWELNKQALLNAWDAELIRIKQVRANKEAELDRLAIEVGLRSVVLLNAKVRIELQAEALRLQLANIEDSSATYEAQLALQKVETAKKKLEIIPVLQEILAVEEEIIETERKIVDKEEILVEKTAEQIEYAASLVEAETEIADKKREDLIPATQAMTDKYLDLAEATTDAIAIEIEIMAQRVRDAEIAVEKTEKQVLVAEAQIDTEAARLELMDAKISLDRTRKYYELVLSQAKLGKYNAIAELQASKHLELMAQEAASRSNWVNLKTEATDLRLTQDIASSTAVTSESVYATTAIAAIEAGVRTDTATISAAAKLTADLAHIIG